MPKPGPQPKDPSLKGVPFNLMLTPETYSIVKERPPRERSKFIRDAILAFDRDKTHKEP